jgi:metal-sulfur cluster biosynthetic enzyme
MNLHAKPDHQLEVRRGQVWACLESVMDPELDESVTELNFVTRADVDENNRVHIEFRLPTYWCAANFSYLMADDMRRAVSALDWVEGVEVVLGEHMYADKINAGLAKSLSFKDTFGDEADGEVEDVRQTFLVKAFQRRQAALLGHLISAGFERETLVGMTIAELESMRLDADGAKLARRYLDRRGVVGSFSSDAPAFVTADGAKLNRESLTRYVSSIRRVGVNTEFNGALCRGLLAVRFDLETPLKSCKRSDVASSAL